MEQGQCIRRPVVGAAIAVSAGMLLASAELIPSFVFLIGSLLCLCAALVFRNSSRSALPVYLTILAVAACRFLMALPAPVSVSDFSHLSVGATGYVEEVPRVYRYRSGTHGTSAFMFQCPEVRSADGRTLRLNEGMEVQLHNVPVGFMLQIGDRVRVSGRVQQKEFPGRTALELHASYEDLELFPGSEKWSLKRVGEIWRQSAVPRLEAGLESQPLQASVLKALVLGYRQHIPSETLDVFKRTGSMHIFAISGLHVGIVGFLLGLTMLVLGVPRDKLGLVLIPLLGMYVVSTGMKSSALRALLMAVVFLLAPLFRRKPDIPTSVSIAAIVLLMFQPLEILSPGFIFSFTVVIFLVMAFSAIPRPWIQGPWIKRYSVSLLITSLAAGAVAIPLSTLFFGNFAPIALVGNLVVVPLTFCIVLCGWLSILLPMVAEVFNAAACVFIDVLQGSVQWLDGIPGSSFRVEPPAVLAVLLWYAGLAALFTHCRTSKEKQVALGTMVLGLLLGVLG